MWIPNVFRQPLAVAPTTTPPAVPTIKTDGVDLVDRSTYTTGTAVYAAGRLYVIAIYERHLTAEITSAPTISGWSSIRSDSIDVPASTVWLRYSWLYWVPGSGFLQDLSIACTQTLDCCAWSVLEIASGFDTDDPIGISNIATNGENSSITLDIGTLTDTSSRVLMQCGFASNGAAQNTEWSGGYTELTDIGGDQGAAWGTAYGAVGDDTATCTYNNATPTSGEITAIEILPLITAGTMIPSSKLGWPSRRTG